MANLKDEIELRKAYKNMNESFEQVLIFHVGESAGFFSEYNSMILAMLYCLQHRIQFKLYSKDANFGYEQGWGDFFEPFCKEENSYWHHYINMRPIANWCTILKKKKIGFLKWKIKKSLYGFIAIVWKISHPKVLLTQDVWAKIYSKDQMHCMYHIPELNLDGNMMQACEMLVRITWNYRKDINDKLDDYIKSLNLDNGYISTQIRAGDKYIEHDLLPISVYVNYLKRYPKCKSVFVLTDDYSIIEQLKSLYPQWNWCTLCEDRERGYIHSEFKQNSRIGKKKQLIKFFTSMEIIHRSDLFLGTVTSNPSVFCSLRDSDKTLFVDYDQSVFSFMLS